jgi:hypothetical protein
MRPVIGEGGTSVRGFRAVQPSLSYRAAEAHHSLSCICQLLSRITPASGPSSVKLQSRPSGDPSKRARSAQSTDLAARSRMPLGPGASWRGDKRVGKLSACDGIDQNLLAVARPGLNETPSALSGRSAIGGMTCWIGPAVPPILASRSFKLESSKVKLR